MIDYHHNKEIIEKEDMHDIKWMLNAYISGSNITSYPSWERLMNCKTQPPIFWVIRWIFLESLKIPSSNVTNNSPNHGNKLITVLLNFENRYDVTKYKENRVETPRHFLIHDNYFYYSSSWHNVCLKALAWSSLKLFSNKLNEQNIFSLRLPLLRTIFMNI
jgi:hypothetical protein